MRKQCRQKLGSIFHYLGKSRINWEVTLNWTTRAERNWKNMANSGQRNQPLHYVILHRCWNWWSSKRRFNNDVPSFRARLSLQIWELKKKM